VGVVIVSTARWSLAGALEAQDIALFAGSRGFDAPGLATPPWAGWPAGRPSWPRWPWMLSCGVLPWPRACWSAGRVGGGGGLAPRACRAGGAGGLARLARGAGFAGPGSGSLARVPGSRGAARGCWPRVRGARREGRGGDGRDGRRQVCLGINPSEMSCSLAVFRLLTHCFC